MQIQVKTSNLAELASLYDQSQTHTRRELGRTLELHRFTMPNGNTETALVAGEDVALIED